MYWWADWISYQVQVSFVNVQTFSFKIILQRSSHCNCKPFGFSSLFSYFYLLKKLLTDMFNSVVLSPHYYPFLEKKINLRLMFLYHSLLLHLNNFLNIFIFYILSDNIPSLDKIKRILSIVNFLQLFPVVYLLDFVIQ